MKVHCETIAARICWGILLVLWGCSCGTPQLRGESSRPNIVWITSEDNGPHLGCYGDEYADTPNLDQLAAKGLIYLNCWSTAPVCAPARTTLISGMYPPSTGSEHMRSTTRLPAAFKMYPQYLREAGYYCTNNSKEDYNLEKPGAVWDDSSRKAHWRNRQKDQPFFAIFNITTSHESQIRKRPHQAVHDPTKVRVPAYHPDTPEVREDWAQYYDKLTEMDAQAGQRLRELEKAGLADDTIIFYYGDHGSGMPRSKRWPYNSGLRVPLIVHIPEKFKDLAPVEYATGGQTDRLVGFIDLAPTLLSLAGVEIPQHFQGHAFLGKAATPEQPYLFGFRGRMDERYDMVRVVRDKRYIYIRNYMPHKIYGQFIAYMFQTPTTRVWKQMFDAGSLNEAQSHFWQTKAPEELYDLESDPDEVDNLAGSSEHRAILKRLRKQQEAWALRIRDVGFLPEHQIHHRAAGQTPYEFGHDMKAYPLDEILEIAGQAASLKESDLPAVKQGLTNEESVIRYWAAMGILMRGDKAVSVTRDSLREMLEDPDPSVRLIAAQALGQYGDEADVEASLPVLIEYADVKQHGVYLSMLALNAIDAIDGRAADVQEELRKLPQMDSGVPGRMKAYVRNLLNKTLTDLQ